ncbi:hypothetical protein FHX42_001370 [Saccharopolyspora lacisalsi]|uniref:Methyltransferase domain-containing protein n=1 Tax=Halosaccharopolyspora lacisalsi TaxID=1000566 RepID=A0A839DXT9_9PSEU|nr:hypothetical protein [Halosaccharopolyspora lacisalsi]MBA8824041.1 hypothetical protein [Halosaccharopolyspora lacisalsi]
MTERDATSRARRQHDVYAPHYDSDTRHYERAIPDDRAALTQTHRVLRPGGHLVLLGHVASPHRPVRTAQRLLERLSTQRGVQDAHLRHVAPLVRDTGFTIVHQRHHRLGTIERLTATKPPEWTPAIATSTSHATTDPADHDTDDEAENR